MSETRFTGVLIAALLALIASQCLDKRAFRTKFIVSTLLLSLPATWLFLDSLSGNGLDYATLYHMRTGLSGAAIADFKHQILDYLGHLILALGIAASAAWVAVRLARTSQIALAAYCFAALVIFVLNPLSQDALRLMKSDTGNGSKVHAEYIKPSATDSFKKKNIVLIYAESLERTYFDQKAFPGLVPNLQRLSTQGLDYTDVRAAPGTGWTIAGIVSSLCGVPLTVWRNEDGNELGRVKHFLPGATCLSDWLAKRGYHLEFMGGADGEFAGKAKFLSEHGFSTILESHYFQKMHLPSGAFSGWGVHDDILFEHAAARFDELSAHGEPFMLSVLTLGTHHPSGNLSAACAGMKYTRLTKPYPILDAVSCSELLISRFVDRIRSGPYAENTTIVLASDHLGMPNDARDIISTMQSERRNMLLIFDSSLAPRKIDLPATTVDTGAILLSVLGGNDKLGFGRVPQAHPTDGLSRATVNGQDTSSYDAYAQSLWQLGDASLLQLLSNNQIRIGSQRIAPPLTLILDNQGITKRLVFGEDYKKSVGAAEHWVHVTHCTEFKSNASADWCALESSSGGKRYLYDQDDLLNGINLRKSPPKDKQLSLSMALH